MFNIRTLQIALQKTAQDIGNGDRRGHPNHEVAVRVHWLRIARASGAATWDEGGVPAAVRCILAT